VVERPGLVGVAVHQAAPAVVDADGLDAELVALPDQGADGRIEPGCVAAARENTDAL
jgi:hypothetical protein